MRRKESSGKNERQARVSAIALFAWGSANDAHQFLAAPHPLLLGRKPLAVSKTKPGARRVEGILWRLYYGVAA